MLIDPPAAVVFLFDVDNTLLDNDRFRADLDAWLTRHLGADQCQRYARIYDERRQRLGYADYLGSIQALRAGLEHDPALPELSRFVLDYPFTDLFHPGAPGVLAELAGPCAIVSDGDIVFQPHKIRRSGLWDAVDGRVMVCLHKQDAIRAIEERYPARHYVMVDDKVELLADMKRAMGERLSTVFVRQGHYAAAADPAIQPPPDHAIEHIGQLADIDFRQTAAAT
ncbi:MAG: HAD family hydrolase [Xanthomonadales bacterium]|nr:HAD family hydrolase [Xanthomonadales bacterium]